MGTFTKLNSIDPITVGLTAVILLSLFLYYRLLGSPRSGRKYQPTGTPIDTSAIASKVAAVRHNPVGALEAKAVRKSRRSTLIAAAREAIRGLPFFRAHEHEHGN